ncbi:hypothetical protein K438DRAFT_1813164 [Mycena galopus ATCC 62051]|nr:hypothetical protein K438DRAFT_1813164 [Mycena galopus ATCC 62051]
MAQPLFPPELERKIFELAVQSSTKLIPKLLLVARRVKIWVEPMLYPVVVFRDPLPGHISFNWVDRLPPTHIPQIRHLFVPLVIFERQTSLLLPVLAKCSSLHDLVIMNTPMIRESSPLLPTLLAEIPLTRLCLSAENLFAPRRADFTHALFAQITHLDLLDEVCGPWDPRWTSLARMQRLTHLAFDLSMSKQRDWESVLHGALAHCPALQVLALMWSPWLRDEMRENRAEIRRLAEDDPRFVIVLQTSHPHDWETGARGGIDAWSRAEDLVGQSVEARTAGLL